MRLLALYVAWIVFVRGNVEVKLVEWQGCPDCGSYGDNLVEQGLKKGLGNLMNLKVYLAAGAHGDAAENKALHEWVACGNTVDPGLDRTYTWYQVSACAMTGAKTVDECNKTSPLPAAAQSYMAKCLHDTNLQSIVEKNHQEAAATKDYPSIWVDGTQLQQPDQNANRLDDLLLKVCGVTLMRTEAKPQACIDAGNVQAQVSAQGVPVTQYTLCHRHGAPC